MNPTFSMIIPCYKAESTIANAIGAILDQDFKDFEIICVLDGPDELTESVVRSFPSVKCEVIPHGGACAARNAGFRLSKGRYVIFSDADVYWKPGMLRVLKEKFEKHPEADFIYGGYTWTDQEGAHVPHDFDPYLLGVMNFIDTGNPVKREWVEKVGGWDESLKRWQDWDLWYRIVKAGGHGVRIEEITRTADFPKPGSISGTDNYAPTYHIVRKKHNMENRPICMTTIAAYGHGLRLAKTCGWDFWHNPAMLPNDYRAIYLLGMFPESIEQHAELFTDWRVKGPRKCVYIIHWIGTDILHMRTMLPFIQIKQMRLMFEKYNVIHLFQSEENAEEMRELGFKGEVLPLPVKNEFQVEPFPENFTVAVYDHGGINEKWHKWLVMELVKAMPDVQWIFYGDKHAVGKERNMEWLGRVSIRDVIRRSHLLLRLTIHDGYPVAPVEFLFSGRRVITNTPSMPFTTYLNLGVINDERGVELKEMVYREIRKAMKEPPLHPDHKRAVAHYEEMLSPEKFKKKVMRMVEDAEKKSKN